MTVYLPSDFWIRISVTISDNRDISIMCDIHHIARDAERANTSITVSIVIIVSDVSDSKVESIVSSTNNTLAKSTR